MGEYGLTKKDVRVYINRMGKQMKYIYPQNLSVVMWESYSAKEFLPVLGLKPTTFHAWGRRGNIDLPLSGRGKSLELTGHELVFLAALATLSTLQQPPSVGKARLKKQVEIFTDSFVRGITAYRYCVAKTRPLGEGFMEWSLCDSASPVHHIVDAVGGEPVPGWIVLDLLAIAEKVAKGLYGIYNER